VFADNGINIAGQYLRTDEKVGYVVIDIDAESSALALESCADSGHHPLPRAVLNGICWNAKRRPRVSFLMAACTAAAYGFLKPGFWATAGSRQSDCRRE
jgi:hypothetical protein